MGVSSGLLLEKVLTLRREDVEQPAFLEADRAVQHGRGNVNRVARGEAGLLALDGEFELARQAVADLFVNVPVFVADRAVLEHDFDRHQAAAMRPDLAGDAAFLDGTYSQTKPRSFKLK